MTLENQVYGPAWVCCALCGVRQPLTSLTPGLACKDLERCERWQAELKAQRTAAAKADPVLFGQAVLGTVATPDGPRAAVIVRARAKAGGGD